MFVLLNGPYSPKESAKIKYNKNTLHKLWKQNTRFPSASFMKKTGFFKFTCVYKSRHS